MSAGQPPCSVSGSVDPIACRLGVSPRRGSGALGGAATLTQEASTFALGGASPNTDLLPVGEGVVEASDANRAVLADRLRLIGCVVLIGIEERGVESSTRPQHPPFQFVVRQREAPLVSCEIQTIERLSARFQRRGPTIAHSDHTVAVIAQSDRALAIRNCRKRLSHSPHRWRAPPKAPEQAQPVDRGAPGTSG